MATIQSLALRLVQIISPTTKDGQMIQGASSGVSITNCANNGSGLIRATAPNHGLKTDDRGNIQSVAGTVEANNTASNPAWRVVRISADVIDLVGSAFVHAYTGGGTLVGALVGSVEAGKYPAQSIADFLNAARMALLSAISAEMGSVAKSIAVSGAMRTKTNLTFASGVAGKPADYIEASFMSFIEGKTISVLPLASRPYTLHLDSTVNPLVYEEANQFRGNSANIPDRDTYILNYFGLPDITLADIMDPTTQEVFDRNWHETILELAQAAAREQGATELNAMASTLVKGRTNAAS